MFVVGVFVRCVMSVQGGSFIFRLVNKNTKSSLKICKLTFGDSIKNTKQIWLIR